MAKMINEDKRRLKNFDKEANGDVTMLHESNSDEIGENDLDIN